MKYLVWTSAIFGLVGCGGQPATQSGSPAKAETNAHQHGHAGHESKSPLVPMIVQLEPKSATASQLTTLRITIPDKSGTPVKDFDINHDAKVHVIVIRAGLDEFAHLHPEVSGEGVLTAKYAFPVGGKYHLFADYQPTGQPVATATAMIDVAGAAPAAVALTANVPGSVKGNGVVGNVAIENAKAGGQAKVRFELMYDEAQPLNDLEPYMGARGHLVIVNAEAKEYVHAHPMDERATDAKNVVIFQASFPGAGLFKGWGQFKQGGQVRIVPFVVRISN